MDAGEGFTDGSERAVVGAAQPFKVGRDFVQDADGVRAAADAVKEEAQLAAMVEDPVVVLAEQPGLIADGGP